MNDYIRTMREMIGHETLITVGCGAIIEDERGRILLQKRTDFGVWGVPGGLLEVGETFEEAVRREVKEETGLSMNALDLFGVYSGTKGFAEYENGDKVFSVQIIFKVTDFRGTVEKNKESHELCFLHKEAIPQKLNPHQAPFIHDWMNDTPGPIIK
ncbi:NUDIX hydrolase [Salimicrobium halophilum]|uniref:NUDIX domain-containing protein n=1 Tax=Salimicrobium halophilum TaxID=86666 RepID=A0A1G8RGD3_9BACI|nr:NUDIX domain-containing protein [Salimicrobium halophilum]SDJ16018.1 NUDIX domain-containing protein [Salimicrobium halophilum]